MPSATIKKVHLDVDKNKVMIMSMNTRRIPNNFGIGGHNKTLIGGMPLVPPPRGTPAGTPEQPLAQKVLQAFYSLTPKTPQPTWITADIVTGFARRKGLSPPEIDVAVEMFAARGGEGDSTDNMTGHDASYASEATPAPFTGTTLEQTPRTSMLSVASKEVSGEDRVEDIWALQAILHGIRTPKTAAATNYMVPHSHIEEATLYIDRIATTAARQEHARVRQLREDMAQLQQDVRHVLSILTRLLSTEHGALAQMWQEAAQASITPIPLPADARQNAHPPGVPTVLTEMHIHPTPSPTPSPTLPTPTATSSLRAPVCMSATAIQTYGLPQAASSTLPQDKLQPGRTGTQEEMLRPVCHDRAACTPTEHAHTTDTNRQRETSYAQRAARACTRDDRQCREVQSACTEDMQIGIPAMAIMPTPTLFPTPSPTTSPTPPPASLPARPTRTTRAPPPPEQVSGTMRQPKTQPLTLPLAAQYLSTETTPSPMRRTPDAQWTRRRPRSSRGYGATTGMIVDFVGEPPSGAERMAPQVMRDSINSRIGGAGVRVSGVQFTGAGNIAVTPMAPATAADLLQQTVSVGACTAHGQPQSSLIFELDEPWPSVVVRRVQIPQRGDIWEVEQELCEELGEWNPLLRLGVKEVRVMCRPEDVQERKRAPVRIAFTTEEGCEQALREGICAFGERLRVDRYTSRDHARS